MCVKYREEDAYSEGPGESFGQEHELCVWIGKSVS